MPNAKPQRRKFKDLATTKQGYAGEAIALQYFSRCGYVVYPVGTDGPHPVDFWIYSRDSGKLTAVEVKTYPRLFSSKETGIDLPDYKAYIELEKKTGVKLWLLFVDVFEGCMYGAYLSKLLPGARLAHGKMFFPLARFQQLRRLTPAELETLKPPQNPASYRYLTPYFSPLP